MRATLEEIISRLRHGDYKNEEHVRLAIVCRLLNKLGWDIWNPIEVNAEFSAMRTEDASRVDVAIFMPPQWLRPAVFVEVKSVGKLMGDIDAAERQLRDYNRNNQADISVLTDGRIWRFYLASASGEFSQKCFEKLDMLDDESVLDDVELAFDAFLSRSALQSGKAVEEARTYLKRTDAQRIMYEVLPLSQRDADENPTLSLVDCFIKRCVERGVECEKNEALNFVRNSRHRQSPLNAIVQPSVGQLSNQTLPARLTTKTDTSRTKQSSVEILFIQGKRGTDASGHELSNGKFVVFANSFAAELSPGFKDSDAAPCRVYHELVKKKILCVETVNGIRVYKLMRDYEFSSSSAAASVFLGVSASGPREWKKGK